MKAQIFILFHGRFPSEKAAALFVMESARAYAAHLPVTIVAPWRLGRTKELIPTNVQVRYMFNIDLFSIPVLGSIAFPLSYILYSVFSILFLFFRARFGDVIETNEVLPALFSTFVSHNVVYEVHDFPERHLWLYRAVLRRVRFVLATNEWKKQELIQRFHIPAEKIIMERNGVNVVQFAPQDRNAARERLGLPHDSQIVLYTGHLYGWKGTDTLAAAASLVPKAEFYFVGGTEPDIAEFKKKYGQTTNIHIIGFKPHSEIPLWQAATDVLVLPNTAKEEISAHYTSPMKLFEYMASSRTIVASRIPSIMELLNDSNAYLFEPDDSQALAEAIGSALQDSGANEKAVAVRSSVEEFSWEKRAARLSEKLFSTRYS